MSDVLSIREAGRLPLIDFFAACALPAIIAARCEKGGPDATSDAESFMDEALCLGLGAEIKGYTLQDGKPATYARMIAGEAYDIAAAMLAMRSCYAKAEATP